jgi:tRNA A-37 threonylcarbamoyl transferase component Bud32
MTTYPTATDLPSHIGHYRLIRKIGTGGMSMVYEAFDDRLKRAIAIKILHPALAESHEYKVRFLREAQAVARLTHPNILQIYDIANPESSNDQLYIVTELVSGQTLKEWAQKNNIIEVPELSAIIICQVAQALEHAHQKGIIHRDIKPENIMVTAEGLIKLMDFGIASIGSEESLTQAGTLLGSLAHLAPEIIKGEKASEACDIFSLSTIFYWLVSGQLPFNGDSPHSLLKAIVDEPAIKIQRLSPYISDHLAMIIDQGLNKNPSARIKTASLLITAIGRALNDLGVVIEPKKFAAVLSGEDLASFKCLVLEQIGAKKIFYEQRKEEAKALELQCRLDASPKGPAKKINVNYIGAIGFGLVGLIGFFTFNSQSKPKESPKPSAEPSFQLEENAALASEPIAEPVIAEKTVELPPEEIIPPKTAAATKPEFQEIKVVIKPFANVLVNGKLLAKNQKSISLKLPIGTHRLSFSHTYAATVEKQVKIDRIGQPVDLSIVLNKTKPAFLIVKSALDANVAISGSFKGSTDKSLEKPIVIPLPDRTHAVKEQVLIQRDGYEPMIESIEFVAGQIKILKIELKALSAS